MSSQDKRPSSEVKSTDNTSSSFSAAAEVVCSGPLGCSQPDGIVGNAFISCAEEDDAGTVETTTTTTTTTGIDFRVNSLAADEDEDEEQPQQDFICLGSNYTMARVKAEMERGDNTSNSSNNLPVEVHLNHEHMLGPRPSIEGRPEIVASKMVTATEAATECYDGDAIASEKDIFDSDSSSDDYSHSDSSDGCSSGDDNDDDRGSTTDHKRRATCSTGAASKRRRSQQWSSSSSKSETKKYSTSSSFGEDSETKSQRAAVGIPQPPTTTRSSYTNTRETHHQPSRETPKNGMKWFQMYQKLMVFSAAYGHFKVPRENREYASLASWVYSQQRRKRENKLRNDRIELLNAIGFDWDAANTVLMKQDGSWLMRYEQLKVFCAEHGHCKVPRENREDASLANWVQSQRRRKRQNKLRSDRVELLNAIGFNWDAAKTVLMNRDGSWLMRYEQLKVIRAEHGHCKVPREKREDELLANWVNKQRRRKREKKLPSDRVELLDAIGFDWGATNIGSGFMNQDGSWLMRYEKLKVFCAEHGHCKVPKGYKEDAPLSNWVHSQRRRKRENKLRDDRVELLNAIGFNWG